MEVPGVMQPAKPALSLARESMPRSGIRAFMDMAWSAGDVIHLEVGEPNFPTPPHVIEAADRAAIAGQTKYVANAGTVALRGAISDKLRTRNAWDVSADDVIVTAGGVQALYLAFLSLLDPGDEVLIPDPGWPNFRMIVTALGGRATPYTLRPEHQYVPTIDGLEEAASGSPRAIILNSPSNPTGAVIGRPRMAELLAWAHDRGIWVVSDECYDEIVYDDQFVSAGAVGPTDHLISCYSFSKTYSMTGWRVGYAVTTSSEASELMAKLQEAVVSCVNAPAQAAAVAALQGPQDVVADMRSAYHRRSSAAIDLLCSAGVEVLAPSGAFYLWLRTAPWASDDWALAIDLLDRARVAVAPGSAFGSAGRGFLRLSLATEEKTLVEGIHRMLAHLEGRAAVNGG